jgi:hypothetical protein
MCEMLSGGFSETGKLLLVGFITEGIGSRIKLPELLEQLLGAPVAHRDVAHWWVLMIPRRSPVLPHTFAHRVPFDEWEDGVDRYRAAQASVESLLALLDGRSATSSEIRI